MSLLKIATYPLTICMDKYIHKLLLFSNIKMNKLIRQLNLNMYYNVSKKTARVIQFNKQF